jgi:DNA-binding response OmpR family regulator
MAADVVVVAGLDQRSLLIEAPLLRRGQHAVVAHTALRELLEDLRRGASRLLVLGPQLGGCPAPEVVARVRASGDTRGVSILVLLPLWERPDTETAALHAGANAVLRRPLDPLVLESWIGKLLTVARRVEVRVPVEGQVIGTAPGGVGRFYGLTRNISTQGVLLASPVRMAPGQDVELDIQIAAASGSIRALGRVVREAPHIKWPYLGYGIEFLYVPTASLGILGALVATDRSTEPLRQEAVEPRPIQATVRLGQWVYELLAPVPGGDGWHVEILRADRHSWRPGRGGPFFVIAAPSPEEALVRARMFVKRQEDPA